jgi:hypothetical protein
VSGNAPNPGEGQTGQQPQAPAQAVQVTETPVPSSMNDTLPKGL